MISFDTNLLLYSLNRDCPEYKDARAFFASLPTAPGTVAVCELVLGELYVLLRNPAVLNNPLDAADAVALIQTFRQHPTWTLFDYPGDASAVMDEVWRLAAQPGSTASTSTPRWKRAAWLWATRSPCNSRSKQSSTPRAERATPKVTDTLHRPEAPPTQGELP